MPPEWKPVSACRACGGTKLTRYLDLGAMPLANALLDEQGIHAEKRYPLQVMVCEDCFFSQLSIVVNPDIMFREYRYRSFVSDSFKVHCLELARQLRKGPLGKGDLVVDIASNDGTLLSQFKSQGSRVLGVDPAVNLARIANEAGIETLPRYWNPSLAREVAASHGKARIITAFNVFAHVDDLQSFVKGIRELLADDGYFIIESPHLLALIQNAEFDTIYHEHLSYLLVRPLTKLMTKAGLRIARVEKTSIHGGSVRFFIEKQEKPDTSDGSVQEIVREEEAAGMFSLEQYVNFRKSVEKIRDDLVSATQKLKSQGKSIAAFGASAKGAILLNYCGLGKGSIDCIFDDTPEKQDKLSPGVHLPITPGTLLLEKKPDCLLLLAWNFADEIMRKNSAYREQGGKFIIPIPRVEIR